MPTTDQKSDSKPVSALPGQEFSCWSAGATTSGLPSAAVGDPVGEPVPAADPVQPDEGQRRQRGDDHEELQHLVVDGGAEPAEGDVGQHDRRGDDQREPQRPAEQRVDDRAEQVEVDAGDEQLGHGERDRVDQVRAGAEPAAHELRHRADLRAVVEGHHHDAEEEHRRDRADPEVVHGRDADLRAVRRHAHDLDGAEVGRDEGQPGHPGRQRPAGQEEVDRVRDLAAGQQPDAEDDREVEEDDQVVDRSGVDDGVGHDGDVGDAGADMRTPFLQLRRPRGHRTRCPRRRGANLRLTPSGDPSARDVTLTSSDITFLLT